MRIHQKYLGTSRDPGGWCVSVTLYSHLSQATENSWSPFKRIWNQNVELDICVMNLAARCMTWGSSRWLARLTSEPRPPPPELANILVAMIATLVVITLAPPCTMTTAVIMANTPTTSSILCACLCVLVSRVLLIRWTRRSHQDWAWTSLQEDDVMRNDDGPEYYQRDGVITRQAEIWRRDSMTRTTEIWARAKMRPRLKPATAKLSLKIWIGHISRAQEFWFSACTGCYTGCLTN